MVLADYNFASFLWDILVVFAFVIWFWLLITFDLDRPTRGLIKVPTTALADVRISMALPPAAAAP